MAQHDWLVTATPPTPNGDLHVGHMSGPYLAADIFCRARRYQGDRSAYVCYGDDNQSYVVTTARRLGEDPGVLLAHGNGEIERTLDAYSIDMDDYGRPDGGHEKVVRATVRRLFEAGLIVERDAAQCVDDSGQPLYEAFAGGFCNVCLETTRGGICEACGHPNDPVDLLSHSIGTTHGERNTLVKTSRLVLPVEDYRDELVAFYRTRRGKWRPHLIRLVDELLEKPLADYPISHPGTWGIGFGLPGWENHVINVWAEMGIGLIHSLKKHRSDEEVADGAYVQFLGYDNSYFFAVVHPVLQFALRRAGDNAIRLPDYIVTNEFYNLQNRKFSTSQGHALWGRELLDHISPDEARYFLSLHGPEMAESNFELPFALETVEADLRGPLARIRHELSRLREAGFICDAGLSLSVLQPVAERFDFFCRPEHFSSRELARILRNLLAYLDEVECDFTQEADRQAFVAGLRFWCERAAVIMPRIARDLRTALP